MSDDPRRVWNVEIRRDEESGPTFYVVHVREPDSDPELSKARHVPSVDSVRAMLMDLHNPEITAKVMFGGWNSVSQEQAADLLAHEAGTRIVAKVTASVSELLSSFSLLKAT